MEEKINFILLAEIINDFLTNNGYPHIRVTPEQLARVEFFFKAYGQFLPGEPFNDFCGQIFESSSVDFSKREDLELYHFKSAEVALAILKSQSLQASHLLAQSKNDEKELRHFVEVIGHPLATNHEKIPETFIEAFKQFQTIDELRDEAYALCFTKSDSKEIFWNDYADHHKGVCFKFLYRPNGENLVNGWFPIYYLRGIIYDQDPNSKFSFLKEMNKAILDSLGAKMMLTYVTQLAMNYKRSKYKDEDEIRLSIVLAYLNAHNSNPGIVHKTDPKTGRKFLPIYIKGHPLDFISQFPLELELVEIQCGKHMDPNMKGEIIKTAQENFPNARIIDLAE